MCLVGGVSVWYAENRNREPIPAKWDWAELLEHMTGIWPWLVYEEVFPRGRILQDPARIWSQARDSQNLHPLSNAELREWELFLHRHDLSGGLDGSGFPPVFLLREGNMCWVVGQEPETAVLRPFQEIKEILEELGDVLAEHVAGSIRAKLWKEREEQAGKRFFDLRTALEVEDRESLEGNTAAEAFWEVDREDDSELMAAARMSSAQASLDSISHLIELIRSIPFRKTSDLDDLALKVREVMQSDHLDLRPFEQGYIAARGVRRELGLDVWQPYSSLEDDLCRWGVEILEKTLERDGRLDAVACWGPRHGPAIILNVIQGGRVSQMGGRRSTLAHEFCHLLLDRDGSLPMAEVLGGNVSCVPEQRANAFAAELLLPRETALEKVRQAEDLNSAVEELITIYAVSRQLAANQVRNSPGFELTITSRQEQDQIIAWAEKDSY